MELLCRASLNWSTMSKRWYTFKVDPSYVCEHRAILSAPTRGCWDKKVSTTAFMLSEEESLHDNT